MYPTVYCSIFDLSIHSGFSSLLSLVDFNNVTPLHRPILATRSSRLGGMSQERLSVPFLSLTPSTVASPKTRQSANRHQPATYKDIPPTTGTSHCFEHFL